MILRGDAAAALTDLSAQYAEGADPLAVLRDLAEITHWVSVVQITPDAAEDPTISPDERARGAEMAAKLPMRVLSRMWQMLLKALEEVAAAPNAMMAAEMAVIRLTHVADLPAPEELVRKLQNTPPSPPAGPGGGPGGGGRPAPSGGGGTVSAYGRAAGPQAAPADAPDQALARFPTFGHVVELIRANRDVKLLVEVETGLRLVRYQPGRIEFEPAPGAAGDLAQRLGSALQRWSGNRWGVSVVSEGGQPTIAEVRDAEENALRAEAQAHPLMQAVLARFPKAKITSIRTAQELEAEAVAEALPEVEDEWDPFEED